MLGLSSNGSHSTVVLLRMLSWSRARSRRRLPIRHQGQITSENTEMVSDMQRDSCLSQKRVGCAFLSDGAGWPMPADKHQVITKRQHLCFDGLDQSRVIPARKIGSAHGTLGTRRRRLSQNAGRG